MKNKQVIVIIAPLLIIISMVPIYQRLSTEFGESIGWYLGFFPYWLLWCGIFPLWLIGKERLGQIIRPQKLKRKIILLLVVPIVGAATYKLFPGMNYSQDSIWLFLMMLSTAFGNGFFEEVYWRGVYMELFPNNVMFRIIWPSI
jgi:membrane protease YdiL (CAAX protease family)